MVAQLPQSARGALLECIVVALRSEDARAGLGGARGERARFERARRAGRGGAAPSMHAGELYAPPAPATRPHVGLGRAEAAGAAVFETVLLKQLVRVAPSRRRHREHAQHQQRTRHGCAGRFCELLLCDVTLQLFGYLLLRLRVYTRARECC